MEINSNKEQLFKSLNFDVKIEKEKNDVLSKKKIKPLDILDINSDSIVNQKADFLPNATDKETSETEFYF